ncbi:hypothetical protein ACFOD9_12325 [Novosphingobium bradum]|uniref:Uncharacterized protein n=1 Tax=Novosphingobium bradum TaxID=1737444 RepID=A0ABV7IST8_9SPHN
MARPALLPEQKRKQIAVRLGPEDRVRVQATADRNGHGLGTEIEELALEQLAYLETNDEPTRAFLHAITAEIAEIESVTKRHWYKDRATWAAVAEMLRIGPIRHHEADRPRDDEAASAAWQALLEVQFEKERIADQLRALRISVTPEHPVKTAVNDAGLFGELTVTAEFAYAIRETERAAMMALPDGAAKEQAGDLFRRLVELDHEEQELEEQCAELKRPYAEADRYGRDTYHRILKERAQRLRAAGEKFEISHFMGIFY